MEWFNAFFDGLTDISSSPWFYLIIIVMTVLDAVIPVAPSETLVIVGGVSAGLGNLTLVLVIAAGMFGAILGDNIAYLLGRKATGFVQSVAQRRPKLDSKLEWASEQILKRGGMLLVVARFIPGGRTALTISCGLTQQPQRWFLGWTTVAGFCWATYAALLGFLGGKTFEENHTAAFLMAFAGAVLLTGLVEVFRRVKEKRAERPQPSHPTEPK